MEYEAKFKLLNIIEVAKYLGLSPRTIYNKISAGTFPVKPKWIGGLVKFDLKDVDAYIEGAVEKKKRKKKAVNG